MRYITVSTVFLLTFLLSPGFVSSFSEEERPTSYVLEQHGFDDNLEHILPHSFLEDLLEGNRNENGKRVSCRAWRSRGFDRHIFGHGSCASCLRRHGKCKNVCDEEETFWECSYRGTTSEGNSNLVEARRKKKHRAQRVAENRCYDRYFECEYLGCNADTVVSRKTYMCKRDGDNRNRERRKQKERERKREERERKREERERKQEERERKQEERERKREEREKKQKDNDRGNRNRKTAEERRKEQEKKDRERRERRRKQIEDSRGK